MTPSCVMLELPALGSGVGRLNLSVGSDLVPANSCTRDMIGPCPYLTAFSVLSFYTFFIRQNVFRAFCFKRHFALMAVKKCLLLWFYVFKKQKGNHKHLIVFDALQIVIKKAVSCVWFCRSVNTSVKEIRPMSSPMCPAKGLVSSSAHTGGSQPSYKGEPHLSVCCFAIPILSLNQRCSVVFSRFAFSCLLSPCHAHPPNHIHVFHPQSFLPQHS